MIPSSGAKFSSISLPFVIMPRSWSHFGRPGAPLSLYGRGARASLLSHPCRLQGALARCMRGSRTAEMQITHSRGREFQQLAFQLASFHPIFLSTCLGFRGLFPHLTARIQCPMERRLPLKMALHVQR